MPEYIVVYEEPIGDDPVNDEVVLDVDIESPPMAVQADFGAAVTNEAGVVATIGLIITILGGLGALVAAGLFWYYYPEAWWQNPVRETVTRNVLALSGFSVVALLLGNLMVGFGRNLRARGMLHSLRFIPRR